MKRRLLLLVLVAGTAWGWLGSAGGTAAFDETKQGNTTGAAFVQNLYLWTGDTSRYGQVNAVYHIDVMPSTTVRARWECTAGNQGATDQIGPYLTAHSLDVNGLTDGWSSSNKILSRENTYCSYHIWVTSGAGFRVTSAVIQLWDQEFVGGVGTNPTSAPGATTPPGGSGPTPAPTASPTPSPTPPPAGSIGNCADDGVLRSFAAGSRQCLADLDLGGNYPAGTVVGIQVRTRLSQSLSGQSKQHDSWVICANDQAGLSSGMTALTAGSSTGAVTGASGTAYFRYSHGSDSVTGGSEAMNLGGSHSITLPTGGCRYMALISDAVNAGSVWYSNGTSYITVQTAPDQTPTPTASPSPTPSPTATPAPTCAPGFTWTGTACGSSGTPPWYPPPPPPLAPPSTGPNLGGSGGLDDGDMSPPNSNGLGECTADDGTYSKPGQAALRPLNDTSFPGSINPLDYIPWVGNMVSNVPIVVGNAAQWTVNTGSDWIIPGPCVETLVTDGVDALMEKAPFSIPADITASLQAELGAAGAVSDPCATIAGTEVCVPMSSWGGSMGPWRGIFGAFVLFLGLLSLLRLVMGTFGVSNGGRAG